MTHHVDNFGAIPAPDPDDISLLLKYARFLANFRILGVKNCWGQTHAQ